jgi:DUF438 domain-containing protein
MSLEQLTQSEWQKVRAGEGEIGYAWIKPEGLWPSETISDEVGEVGSEKVTDPDQKKVILNQGGLTREQVNLMLTHLPVDITFVDENDRVGYYSAGKERIFPRSPAIIGRHVQNCHPPRSVHIVEKILGEFKSGNRDSSEFWLRMKERLIHIRYYAVRDSGGNYKGTIEVSQDVTDIKSLDGEKRLLDWE